MRRRRDLGLTPILLTGDNEAVARTVAAEVGIEQGDVPLRHLERARAVAEQPSERQQVAAE